MSLDQLKILQAAFRGQAVPIDSPQALSTSHSREFGACAALLALAYDLELPRILGNPNDPATRCLLAMIIGKLVYSGSKLSLVNLFKMGKFVDWKLTDIEVVKGKPAKSMQWQFDQAAIDRESLIDGCYIAAANVCKERLDYK